MADDWVRAFTDALHALEDRGDVEPLLRQFAPDVALWNLVQKEPRRGEDGARGFWEGYRHQFGTIHSTFERVIVSGDEAALEWRAEGTLVQGGRELRYRGVTLLKRGPGGITEFAGYYDPQPFLESLGVERRAAA